MGKFFKWLFIIILLLLVGVLIFYFAVLRKPDIPYAELEAKYANAESEYLTLDNGQRIHYRDEGPKLAGSPDATPYLLVHGYSASLHTWEPWVEILSQNHRVISVDLPGHGLSNVPDPSQLSILYFVNTLDEVLADLGVEKVIYAGSSMGGNTGWSFALEHPEHIEGLVLVGASGWPRTDSEADSGPAVFKLLEMPIIGDMIRNIDPKPLFASGLKDAVYDTSLITDEMVERYADFARAPGHRDALLSIRQEERTVATKERLAALTTPTLVLQGTHDKLVPARHAELFDDALPNSELIIYGDIGHIPMEEIPERSAQDMLSWQTRLNLTPEDL